MEMTQTINPLKLLTKQTKQVRVVINFPIDEKGHRYIFNYDVLSMALSSQGWQYAFIVHDKDYNKHGELKTPHIHLIIKCNKRHELKYYIYYLADILGLGENLISIQCSDDFAFDLQYLTHKNDSKKTQYKIDEIETNLDSLDFEKYYYADITGDELDTSKLVSIIRGSRNLLEVMEKIGIGRYEKFYRTINTIVNELIRMGALPNSYKY